MLDTDDHGNCCMDALTHHDVLPRTQANWLAPRQEISTCMESIAHNDLWHDCWKVCQEARAPELKPKLAKPETLSNPDAKPTDAKPPHKLGATLKRGMAAAISEPIKKIAKKAAGLLCIGHAATAAQRKLSHWF